jgi:16S rRNA (guanine527-N7)-methyltransferase
LQQLLSYFNYLSSQQIIQLEQLKPLYLDWNAKINVISRKDVEAFYVHHVLHSMAIAKVLSFADGTEVLDVGTGGGFPGIPLAILFPKTQFYLIDSIGKKIKVVRAVADALKLKNVEAHQMRAEHFPKKVDFVVSRAVTQMDAFFGWVAKKGKLNNENALANGILYLKGGDLRDELKSFPKAVEYPISTFFSDPFFETKKVVHVPF